MAFNISDYATLVFDCDGVLINSNSLKSYAFYKTALIYGAKPAEEFINYHRSNGGISRYEKFAYFLNNIVPVLAPKKSGPNLNQLIDIYSKIVKSEILESEVAVGIDLLRSRTINSRWLVVSGGDQAEVKCILTNLKLSAYFDAGIFGSPDSKDVIIKREIDNGNIKMPAVYIGDSCFDFKTASTAGLDFVFISNWTEVVGWREWVEKKKLTHFSSINDMLLT